MPSANLLKARILKSPSDSVEVELVLDGDGQKSKEGCIKEICFVKTKPEAISKDNYASNIQVRLRTFVAGYIAWR